MLAIRGLTKRYANGVRALDDVVLDIPAGMFGLLGPNGAGKSSLMRTLATLQEGDAGSAVFDDGAGLRVDLLREKDRVRRMLGYLPQDFGVYPKVTAHDLLDHFAVLKGFTARGERREVVEGLLRQVNLWDVRKRRCRRVRYAGRRPSVPALRGGSSCASCASRRARCCAASRSS